MERHFDTELKGLKEDILKMGIYAENTIYRSIEALKGRDKTLALNVIDEDRTIDTLEIVIDEKCIDLIARFQPAAKDLRLILMAQKLNAELERISDISVDIAQRVLELITEPLLKPLVDIPKLAKRAQDMVKLSVDSFVLEDAGLAKKVILMDPEADRLRNSVQNELINDFMLKDASTSPRAVQLLLIARFLERICDHATNIAEDVIYMVEAEVVKHRPG